MGTNTVHTVRCLQTALSLAVMEQASMGSSDSTEVCKGVTILLEEGASQITSDSRGNTPLHHAVRLGHVGVVRALLAAEGIELVIDNINNSGK